jgi:cytochrome P450
LESDPHGVFRQYRARAPVIATDRGATIVLRAADVEPLMRDPRVFASGTKLVEMQGVTSGALFDMFQFGMLTANGAEHRKRRSPFSRTFAAGMIAALRPEVRHGAGALIDEWQGAGEVDLVSRYAALLPARVISAILGLPTADIPHFTRLVYRAPRTI